MTLFEEAQRLYSNGVTEDSIAEKLGLGRPQIREWLFEGVRPRFDRYDPDLTPRPDLAYLIGFWLGDGRSAGNQKKVRFKLADMKQLDYVNRLLARLLDREPKPLLMDGPFYVVDYDTSVLYDYLAQPLSKLKPCILAFKADFLRGFFDAEGYVSIGANISKRRLHEVVGAANSDGEYLRLVRGLLGQLEIPTSMCVTNRKGEPMTIRGRTWVRKHDVRHVSITRDQLIRRFFDAVGFRNPAKQEKLEDLAFLQKLPSEERFNWFVNHYEKRGRRWYKKGARPDD